MPITRVQFAQIGSYQPAVDYRKTGTIGVLEGRNFAWDAAGVGSAFASKLVAANQSLGQGNNGVYEIEIGDKQHIAVGEKLYEFVPAAVGLPIGTWSLVETLTAVQQPVLSAVPEHYRGFTSAFMGGFGYACSWNFGVYRVDPVSNTYFRLTSVNTPGFPADSEPVISIAESNGRLVYLTASNLYWSGPAAPEDLVPAIGGAGFQTIAEHIAGEPRALTPVDSGVVVWTTQGAMVAEFVGGQIVFRAYELVTDTLPLSQTGTVRLSNNAYAVVTQLGLFAATTARSPEPLTPLFNEFIREYLRTRTLEVAHVWYTKTANRLFLSVKSPAGSFVETFCLDLGLDKWGIFNDIHLGMFHYAGNSSPLAYLNPGGIVSYFLPGSSDEKVKENPFAPGTFKGLGSTITLGHIRAENLVDRADSLQELQEVVVYRSSNNPGLVNVYEDEGYVFEGATLTTDEGLLSAGETVSVDEGFVTQQSQEESYRLSVLTDLFSPAQSFPNNFYEASMTLARQNILSEVWTGNLPSSHFRLRFIADQAGENFKINAVDCTLATAGQIL